MSKSRILVVEDNPTDMKLVSDVLEWSGYEIVKAMTPGAALKAIQISRPDLILMDIALAGMDGLALVRQLKADESTRRIPVVAVTAFAMKGDEQTAMDAGCNGYITKPIDTRRLAGQIASLLVPGCQP